MGLKHRNKGPWADWRRCYTGRPPLAYESGQRWQQQWQYLTQWAFHGPDFMYCGPPDATINGAPGSETQKFYPIFMTPLCVDGEDRQLGLLLQPWDFDSSDGTPQIKWYPDYTDTGTSSTIYTGAGVDVDDEASYGDPARPSIIERYDDLTYTPPGSSTYACRACILEVVQIHIAALTLWHLPRELSASQVKPQLGHFAHGQVIRGRGDATTNYHNLGALAYYIGDGSRDFESVENLTRRTLFQWGHPISQYWGLTARTDQNIFGGFQFRFKLRNLLEKTSGDLACYPAMVVQGGDSTDSIKYTTTTDGGGTDTWTYTFPAGGHATPTLILPSDGDNNDIDCDLTDVVTCKIEITKDASTEINIHTVALFEGSPWTD